MDLPGTRHYIHHCLKGEEVVEPLEEDRSRICMYGDIDLGNGEKRMASFAAPNNANGCGPCKNEICCKKAGSCIWNSDTGTSTSQDKDKINSSIKIAWLDGEFIKLDKGNNVGDEDPKQDWFSVSCSNGEYIRLDFKDHLTKEETKEGKPYQEYNFKFQTSKDAGVCKFSVYDNDGCQTCDFYSYDTDDLAKASENKGICIPIVPPGNSASCEAGTKSLKEVAYWEEECIGTDWSCEGGCDVYNEDSKRGTNTICGAYGDCGAKFNLAESFSNTGFIRDCDPNDRGYSNIGDACPDGSNRIDPAPDKTNISWNTFVNAGKGLYIGSLDTFIRSVASDNKLSGLTNEQIGAITLGATIAAFFTAIIITAAVMVGSLFTFGQALNVLLIFVLSLSMSGPWGWVISIGVLLAMAITAILLAICKDDEKRDVTFVCKKWEPPQNSNDCHKCNEMQKDGGVLPNDPKLVYDYPKAVKDDPDMYGEYTPYQCTKALCESLGYCQFEDKTVDGPRCLELEPTTIPVKIKFDDVKSTCNDKEPGEVGGCNVDSSTDNLLTISGQLQEFSELNITLKTIDDKGKEIMATCAYTPNFKEAYADLALNFAEKDLLAYKHTLAIANVQQNKSFSLQVFCKGTNSPAMISPFVIKFESAPEPDLTPPEIKSYDPPLGKAFVTAGTTEKEVTLYLNEQVTSLGGCRFSNESGKDYYNMSRMMSCSTGGLAENPSCTGRLTGLISGEDNKFYFRCKDMAGNVQKTDWPQTEDGSMPYIVRASPPLNITNIKCTHFESDDCSETIYDKSINLTIDTIGGVNDDGIATCSYGLFSGIYTLFNKTGTNNHFQPDINPGKGKHILYISCGDEAGNKVLQEVPLTFDIDNQAPQIISIYDDSGYIKIKTDEKCDCKYQNTYEQFNYNNATLMDSPDGKEHSFINQNIAVNVMCMDRFGNLNGPFNVYAVDKTTS
jgi:hypothetical protein